MVSVPRLTFALRLACASAVTLLAGSASFPAWTAEPPVQTPAELSGPAQVCVTNSCMKPNPPKARDEGAVADAIKRNAPRDLVRAGGTAKEFGDLLRAHCNEPGELSCSGLPADGTEEWASLMGRGGQVGVVGNSQEVDGALSLVVLAEPGPK